MKLEVVRHAQSIFNKYLTSEKNCDLTEEGKQQAKALKGHWDIVFCSPMKRTAETLALSKITYGKLIYTRLCREKRSDICDFLEEENETQKETDQELQERIQSFLLFVKSVASQFQSVLVVTHGDFIHALGKQQHPYPKNAEFQTLDIE
jgi:broad specificity phosphatase PhoE